MKNCFEGFVVPECEECEFWKDGTDPYQGLGCAAPFPIMHCEAFAREDALERAAEEKNEKL